MSIRAITFDCYGTLVDWEAGIHRYAARLLERKRAGVPPEEFYERWEAHQRAMLTPYRGYRDICARSVERVLRDLKLAVEPEDGPALADEIPGWPLFPDTTEALRRLGQRYHLGIISNMDNVVLFETVARLGAVIHMRTSAEDARAYKPDPAPFRLALARLGMEPAEVLHAAFGWQYDLGTAASLGMRTAFVDRSGRGAAGLPEGVTCDLRVASLAELADQLQA
jgi:2-haloalkanoic acid dehalogenase type II